MTHFRSADPDLRPPPARRGRWRRALRGLLWREPSEPDQEVLARVDTGITGSLDGEQGEWPRRISKHPKAKILLTGKPFVVDARTRETEVEGGGVRAIVDDPEHRYVAVIGGDIHNYQRYPVRMRDGRTIQHIVTGAQAPTRDDPPLEDWIRGREQPDGTWTWEVLLD
jgi:hypothetical protein